MNFKEYISPGIMRFICTSEFLSFLVILIVVYVLSFLLRIADMQGLNFLFNEKLKQINSAGVSNEQAFYFAAMASSIFFVIFAPIIIYLSLTTKIDINKMCANSNSLKNFKGVLFSLLLLMGMSVFMVIIFPFSSQRGMTFIFYNEYIYLLLNVIFIYCFAYTFFWLVVFSKIFLLKKERIK